MKKMIFAGLAALGLLAAGCGKDVAPETAGTGGSIRVAIQSENNPTRAVGSPTAEEEKTVKSFTVYVFNNATGALEKSETFTSGLNGEISGLNVASQKKVVVFVNQPAGFPAISNYVDFSEASAMIALSTQDPGDFSAKGLFMSGEYGSPVTLNKDQAVPITVTVKRLTAKIRLGSLKVSPTADFSLGDFALTGVSVQKARDKAPVLGGLAAEGFGYVGGLQADGAVSHSFLHEYYSLPEGYSAGTPLDPKVYFYVFPNDNTNGQATLLSLYGTYKGEAMYYSFRINDAASGSGENAPDGNWIERNKVYTLNVTLKKLGSGGEDPNVPNEEAALDVTVSVADWEGELIQEVEW